MKRIKLKYLRQTGGSGDARKEALHPQCHNPAGYIDCIVLIDLIELMAWIYCIDCCIVLIVLYID